MNERIKELLNVCGMPNEDLMDIYTDTNKSFYMQQFAELIVRECAKVVFKNTGPKSALNVLEHFGVEE